MDNLVEFLKKIGVQKDAINKLNSEGEVNIDDIALSYKTSMKEAISNDPDVVQTIKDAIKGEELSKIEHKVKKTFGLSSEEVKDKKFDEIISAAFEKIKASGNGTSDELQSKIIELSRENKRLLEEVIPAKENEAKEQFKAYKKEALMKGYLANKNLIVKPELAYLSIQDYLTKNYNVDLDDNNQFVLKTKNGLAPLNGDGTKTMTFDEIVDKKLMDENLVRQSNGSPDKANTTAKKTSVIDNSGSEQVFHLPGLKIAEENAERMKNIRTFGQ